MLSRRRLLKGTAVLAAGVATRAAFADDPAMAPVAATNSGVVRGFIDEGVLVFKGISYGDDTAKRRFQAPVRPLPWVGIRDAVAFGPQAPQPARITRAGQDTFAPLDQISPVSSEDCLHLNVWTSGLRDNRKRPVMVFLHGGLPGSAGFTGSNSNGPVYDGVRLVKRGDVVVVTLNHRLNLFGYLFLKELGGPEFSESGNVGQLDLVLALEWVRDNIAEFGGDSKRVTIFGQNDGGAKCATLMAMPRAKGLFHRVATFSGEQITAIEPSQATATARSLLPVLGVARASDLKDPKKVPMEKLVAALEASQQFGPVRDGRTLPQDPFSPVAPALSAHIPMMLGSTHDETRSLLGIGDAALFSLSWEELPARLTTYQPLFGGQTLENLIALYRQWYPSNSPTDIFFAVTTAFQSWRGLVIASERRAAHSSPNWVYEFDWKSPVDGGKWGAAEGMDLPFFFDNVELAASMTGGGLPVQQLAAQMSDSLIAFARDGDPNSASGPKWPQFDLTRRATMCWDVESAVRNDPRNQERSLVSQGTLDTQAPPLGLRRPR
jgi:para-nitrobenzyl esterase